MLANRLSYFFDLRGPSITLDTACSSGLVALHEACKSIRNGEVKQALIGGANLILDPDQTTVMSSMS
jgi:acyl transferase domain-containing protein